MASLDLSPQTKGATRTSIILVIDSSDEYILCSLTPGKNDQQSLDLVLQADSKIAFKIVGEKPAPIHLTGYYINDEHDHCHDEVDGESEEEGVEDLIDDEASEDDGMSLEDEMEEDEDDSFIDDEEDISDDLSEEESEALETDEDPRIKEIDSEDDEEITSPSEDELIAKKKRKGNTEEPINKKTKNAEKPAQPTPEDSKTASPKQKENKTPVASPKADTPKKTELPTKKTLPSGLVIEDVKLGDGVKAKKGRQVAISYKGTLPNGKIFDQSKGNDFLRFSVGAKEVIPGMDIGIQDMSLGGIRRLTIPAALAYGSKKLPGIPANSILHFEIKLEEVKTGSK